MFFLTAALIKIPRNLTVLQKDTIRAADLDIKHQATPPPTYQRWHLRFKLYWQTSGAWARPISGKLIQSSISEFWGMRQADFGKSHPNMDEFSKNWSSPCPDILQKLNSENIDAWVFQKSLCVLHRKTERLFRTSFPGFVNRG